MSLETKPADSPAGVLIQLFSNVSVCMNSNVALIENAFKKGVFSRGQAAAAMSAAALSGNALAAVPAGGGGKRRVASPLPKGQRRKLSGYQLFSIEERIKIKESNPSVGPHDMMKELGQVWTSMSVSEKQAWIDKAASLVDGQRATTGDAAGASGASPSAALPPAPASRKRRQDAEPEAALDETAEVYAANRAAGAVGDGSAASAKGPPLTAEEKAARKARKEAKKAKKALLQSSAQ